MGIEILLASEQAGDAQALSAVLAGTPWFVVSVASYGDAIRALARKNFPIVLCDRSLTGPSWQETVRDLTMARRDTSVILLSDVQDQYLWEEVVQHGGFDVLRRPFDKEHTIALLEFAYTHSKAHWPSAR